MTPYSQPPSLVPPEALPSSGFSFWGLKGQGGSGTGTSPAPQARTWARDTRPAPCPQLWGPSGILFAEHVVSELHDAEDTPGPSLTFPWTGLSVSCSDAPHPPAMLVSPEGLLYGSPLPGATSAPRPSSQGTCPNHRHQPLPSPPLYPSPALHQDSWEPRPGSSILPMGDLSLLEWEAAALRHPVWTPGQLLGGLG